MTRRRQQPSVEQWWVDRDELGDVLPGRPEAVCRDCREPLQYCVCEWPEDVRWSVR